VRKVKRILTEDEWLNGVTRHIRFYLRSIGDPDGQMLEWIECPFCQSNDFNRRCTQCPVLSECVNYEEMWEFIEQAELFALQVYQEYREKFMVEGAGENPQLASKNHPDSPSSVVSFSSCGAGSLEAPETKEQTKK